MLLFSWMTLIDIVRAEFLRARNFEYVRAAESRCQQLGDYVWPCCQNAMVATLTFMPYIDGPITTLTVWTSSSLACLSGLLRWGAIAQGKANLQAPLARHYRVCGPFTDADSLVLLVKLSETPSILEKSTEPECHDYRYPPTQHSLTPFTSSSEIERFLSWTFREIDIVKG